MRDLSKLADIIKDYDIDSSGLYSCRGMDPAELIYDEDGVQLWFCFGYYYMDALGLTAEEFTELKKLLPKSDD